MRIPEIERDLKGHVDKRVIYHMQRQEERIIANEQAITECAKVISQLVDIINNIQAVSAHVANSMKNKLRNDKDNDLVTSVLINPKDKD